MQFSLETDTAGLKNVLMKDFSGPLSLLMIKHNYCKYSLQSKSLDTGGKTKIVNLIVSDCKAIKPIGGVSVIQLKRELRLAMKQFY